MKRIWAYLIAFFALTLLTLSACGGGAKTVPAVKHVWVITLENKGYDAIWGANSQAKYLSQTLRAQGALLTNYFGIGHVSQGNYIAMMSGQPLSLQTQSDCQKYNEFVQTSTVENGIAVGDGCVYPATVKTLPDQLKAKGLSWKAYMEDMGNTATREEATCGRPLTNGQVSMGATDATQSATAADQYAARHNPFVYFHSLIDSGDCTKYVVPLTQLTTDLASAGGASNFSFITPNLCNDAHDGDGTGAAGKGCKDGSAGGLTSADAFLSQWVPQIMASSAYKDGGVIIINFDEGDLPAQVTSVNGQTVYTITGTGESCCNQPLGPNVTRPYSQTIPVSPTLSYVLNYVGIGGDRVGALVLSPYVTAGTVSNVPYNHYALLKSMEDLFGLGGYLGYAGQTGLAAFGADVFAGYY